MRYQLLCCCIAVMLNPFLLQAQYQSAVDPHTRVLNTGNLVGSTLMNLSASVNLNCNIPIVVPPGTAGMQPDLSVNYSSTLSNGILGLGGSLGGISVISRTGSTIYHDGGVDGLDFDENDALSLDGVRLIFADSGTNGQLNFRKEFHDFSRVSAFGTAGSGPAYFTVETKEGLELQYGHTEDSRIEAQGRQDVLLWYLNKVTDRYGNYMQYTYQESASSGESYPLSIEYTGNASQSPFNDITFSYLDRNDIDSAYLHGSLQVRTKLLDKISIRCEDSLVREYQFRYISDFYSKLNEIIEFDPQQNHYNPIVLGWTDDTLTVTEQAPLTYINPENRIYRDFNGDGRMDFVLQESNSYSLYLADTGAIGFNLSYTSNLESGFLGFDAGDYNGDGMADLLCLRIAGDDLQFKLYQSTGNSFTQKAYKNCIPNVGLTYGDFNGDGRREVLYRSAISLSGHSISDYWWCYTYNEPSNSWSARKIYFEGDFVWNPETYFPTTNEYVIDMDGDGRDDLVMLTNQGIGVSYITNEDSLGMVLIGSKPNKNCNELLFGDFNGDGNTDILSQDASYHWTQSLSTGSGLVNKYLGNLIELDNLTAVFYVDDINGDGKTDLLGIGSNDAL